MRFWRSLACVATVLSLLVADARAQEGEHAAWVGSADARAGALRALLDPVPGVMDEAALWPDILVVIEENAASDGPALAARLSPLLRASDPRLRLMAAEALVLLPDRDPYRIGPPEQERSLTVMLSDGDPALRLRAAVALARLPDLVRPFEAMPALVALLRERDPTLLRRTAEALARLPDGARAQAVPPLLALLGESDPALRLRAAEALARLPDELRPAKAVPALVALLAESDPALRLRAAEALARLRDDVRPAEMVPALVALLGASDARLRQRAATALARSPDAARVEAVPALVAALRGGDPDRRLGAAEALARLPDGAPAEAVPALLALLRARDPWLRLWAAEALAGSPDGARAGAVLLDLRRETDPRLLLRAAEALAQLPGLEGPAGVSTLVWALHLHDPDLRQEAAEALARLPDGLAEQAVPDLVDFLRAGDPELRKAAAEALARLPAGARGADFPAAEAAQDVRIEWQLALASAPAGAAQAMGFLAAGAEDARARRPGWRALAHVAAGRDPAAQSLLDWLGLPDGMAPLARAEIRGRPAEAAGLLRLLNDTWPQSPGLRDEATRRVVEIVALACDDRPGASPPESGRILPAWLPFGTETRPCWTAEQRETLAKLRDRMPEGTAKRELGRHLDAGGIPWAAILKNGFAAIGGLGMIGWTALLLAFPYSARIQALLLFQPRARRAFGLPVMFVPELVIWLVPGTRRWLLSPFRETLRASAGLAAFRPEEWFAGSQVVNRRSGESLPITQAMPALDRLIILEGEPGLGKTMFLRWLAVRHRGPLAFVNARECENGVLERVGAMIHDFQLEDADGKRDLKSLRSLIYTGDLALVIDGLNEVSAQTRASIMDFCRDMPRAAIIVATQPLSWQPPDAASFWTLQPLDRPQIAEFLKMRAGSLPEGRPVTGAAFEAKAEAWLIEKLDRAPSAEEGALTQVLLSNPFDLTFAADLISRGESPAPTGLIEAAFRLACAEYERLHYRPFPIPRFSELAYERRLADRNDLLQGEARDEVEPLGNFRLLRLWDRKGNPDENVWRYRHDKVMNLFLYRAFEQHPARLEEHEDDPRFRGVYLILAQQAPEAVATALRDRLVERAAHTQDHSLSDAYVKLLAARKSSSAAAQASPAFAAVS